MKKLKLLILLPLLLVLVACGKSAKETFISRLDENSSQTNQSYTLTTTITKITGDNSDLQNWVNKSFTAKSNVSSKGKKADFALNLSELDSTLPDYKMTIIGNDTYVNLDALVHLQNAIEANPITFETQDFSGKYVNVSDISDHDYNWSEDFSSDHSWLDSLDDNDFSLSGDDSILTLTTTTVAKLLNQLQEELDLEEGQKLGDYLSSHLSDKSSLRITETKDGKLSATASLVFKDSSTLGISTLEAKLTLNQSDYVEPQAPEASSVLSETQLNSSLEQNYKMSDEEFENLYNSIQETASDFTKEQLDSLFAEEKTHMTDKQLQRFNDMIAQATSNQ
ncbi:hypothetical protein [Streptococcus sp. zg-JUN1979]|uniref:hypothetical protein n=1 Tax=Streptococcus sp. zg-JUN1979 TaxID=3391450 RepID=UPI0039A73C61